MASISPELVLSILERIERSGERAADGLAGVDARLRTLEAGRMSAADIR